MGPCEKQHLSFRLISIHLNVPHLNPSHEATWQVTKVDLGLIIVCPHCPGETLKKSNSCISRALITA